MSDLINRQQAIDVLEDQLDYLFMLNKKDNPTAESEWYGINWARNTIAELPTAEPKVTVEAKQNEGLYLNTDEDTLLETEYIVVATDGMYKEYIYETDGKPRRGKWIDHPTVENIGLVDLQGNEMEIAMKMCSECGYEGWETDYCPNCGAKMERSE